MSATNSEALHLDIPGSTHYASLSIVQLDVSTRRGQERSLDRADTSRPFTADFFQLVVPFSARRRSQEPSETGRSARKNGAFS